jgi:tetratricopeptide (TPR) repeat protein
MSSKKKKPGKKHTPSRTPALPRELIEQLEQLERLLQQRRAGEALERLQELERRYPNNVPILEMLGDAASRVGNWPVALDATERIALLRTPDATIQVNRGMAHAACGFPILALRYFQDALARWPDEPVTAPARARAEDLERVVSDLLAQLDMPPAEAAEVAARHEQVRVWMARGKFAEARRVAMQVLSRWPNFVPALNNLAESWFQEGNLAQAVAATRQSIQLVPDNMHARASLVRFLTLQGKEDEARREAEQFRALPVQRPDNRVKIAEALSVLGDDQGVLDTWAQAEQEGFRLSDEHLAWLHHMAAVAAYRTGDEERARALWARALRAEPDHVATRANIDDLDQPLGQQNGPWVLHSESFIPRVLLLELVRRCRAAAPAARDSALQADLQRFLRERPHIVPAVRLLLERGDPFGRQLAVRLAGTARTPELLAALRDFALGQRGTDAMRLQAAFSLAGTDLLPPGEVRLWRQGAWRPTPLPRFEVTRDTWVKLGVSSRGERMYREANEALDQDRPDRAEQLLRQVLQEQPDSPPVRQALARALHAQGREGEADDVMQELHRQHPDYLFAAVHVARAKIRQGELDEVPALLAPFLQRPRLHVSELDALTRAQVGLAVARKDSETAWLWIDLLEAADPASGALEPLRRLAGPRPGPPGV